MYICYILIQTLHTNIMNVNLYSPRIKPVSKPTIDFINNHKDSSDWIIDEDTDDNITCAFVYADNAWIEFRISDDHFRDWMNKIYDTDEVIYSELDEDGFIRRTTSYDEHKQELIDEHITEYILSGGLALVQEKTQALEPVII